jgi:restriction system protein
MAENSLFAILLRKPWWVSALVAAGLFGIVRFAMPPTWFIYAVTIVIPFVVLTGIVGWRQLQAPSAARVAAAEAAARGMGAAEFAAAVEAAWRADGWTVARVQEAGADFEATQGWRRTLIACRRWKSARTGVEPLRELSAARERRESHDAVYLTVGEVSEQAAKYAREHRIRIVHGGELVRSMPALGRPVRGGWAGLLGRRDAGR